MKDIGVYTWRDLLQRGLTQSQARRRIQDGDLVQLRRGWYATRFADPSVVAAVRRGGVLSCVSALRMHGVWVPEHPMSVHARANSKNSRSAGPFCSRSGRPQAEAGAVDDISTSLLHAARCLDAEGFVVVCDSLLNSGRLSTAELRRTLAEAPATTRRLLDVCDGRAQSGTETMVRLRLRGLRIPVRPQVRIPRVGQVDLLVGDRLILEIDGEEFHSNTNGFATDRRRDREAIRLGYIPIRFTYRDVVHDWAAGEKLVIELVRDRRHRAPRQKGHP
ncbi:hypothetical protein GCM10007298_17800 [Williamsia phyllosphaerae]|uniref:DUF559 domain-containing protein n=1 Tax=Williamsia phyllosphaerae TaxID=885042 RepID=A0ABQ1UNR2_9NOCA|nr:hypothetical protein GCM10007298_17800 [Williamsia phyllosphaerae]